jgi:hypothetical protein
VGVQKNYLTSRETGWRNTLGYPRDGHGGNVLLTLGFGKINGETVGPYQPPSLSLKQLGFEG